MIQVALSTRNYKYESGWKVERETEGGVTCVCLIEQSLRCLRLLRGVSTAKKKHHEDRTLGTSTFMFSKKEDEPFEKTEKWSEP